MTTLLRSTTAVLLGLLLLLAVALAGPAPTPDGSHWQAPPAPPPIGVPYA